MPLTAGCTVPYLGGGSKGQGPFGVDWERVAGLDAVEFRTDVLIKKWKDRGGSADLEGRDEEEEEGGKGGKGEGGMGGSEQITCVDVGVLNMLRREYAILKRACKKPIVWSARSISQGGEYGEDGEGYRQVMGLGAELGAEYIEVSTKSLVRLCALDALCFEKRTKAYNLHESSTPDNKPRTPNPKNRTPKVKKH
jgi:hypothetical protein